MYRRARELFDEAFQAFLVNEDANIANDVSERNLCFRFGLELHQLKGRHGFEEHHVDAEYNRKQRGMRKTIYANGHEVPITCDLVVHRRDVQDNILAIEMKKLGGRAASFAADRLRLETLTAPNPGGGIPEHVCGYVLGVFIVFDVHRRRYYLEEYRAGHMRGPRAHDEFEIR